MNDLIAIKISQEINKDKKNKLFIYLAEKDKDIREIFLQFNNNSNFLYQDDIDFLPLYSFEKDIMSEEEKLANINSLIKIKDSDNKSLIIIHKEIFDNQGYDISVDLTFKLQIEQNISMNNIINKLIDFGYVRNEISVAIGEFTVNGSIIDIISYDDNLKEICYRIDFFGNNIEDIFLFDLDNMSNIKKLANINIKNLNLPYGKYKLHNFSKLFKEYKILTNISENNNIIIDNFNLKAKLYKKTNLDIFKEFTHNNKDKKILISASEENYFKQIISILSINNIKYKIINHINEINDNNYIYVAMSFFSQSFIYNDIAFISEDYLVKKVIQNNKNGDRNNVNKKLLENFELDINEGDYVIHKFHGLGKFINIENLEVKDKNNNKIINDFIKIEYAGNDNIFLPVENIKYITKYNNQNDNLLLDKLGSNIWSNKQKKIRDNIREIASELINIAAKRKLSTIEPIDINQEKYLEFEDDFEFTETEDQIKAIADIRSDIKKGKLMDRLICGDVGFGKTEVVMRAIFMIFANENNIGKYQIAVICPTTILANQHYHNFKKRFSKYNIKIDLISRFVKKSQQKIIKESIREGKTDIIIGTHAILANDIRFKNLYMLVIDEEQHFGVSQKEKLKKLKSNLNILSLSATPIPRTLNSSLLNIKDISIIATPPAARKVTKNFLVKYDTSIMKEAINRAVSRNEKIFIISPKIQYLDKLSSDLDKINKNIDIKFGIAHGQMKAKEIEEIANKFYLGEINILLSTSIIESGIDVKEASLMIIYNPHLFGLSQLYQLRGRIGRGSQQSYLYLMPNMEINNLNKDSKKKLQIIKNITNLCSSFMIASEDMDLRGVGNIIGSEQSGHNISQIGSELYNKILNEEIDYIKHNINKNSTQQIDYDFEAEIKLKISYFIPDDYIYNLNQKMHFYRRIANISSIPEEEKMIKELTDKFGPVKEEIYNLIKISHLKKNAMKLNIALLEYKLINDNHILIISFRDNKSTNPDKIFDLVNKNSKFSIRSNKLLYNISSNENIDNNVKLLESFNLLNLIYEPR